MNAGRELDALVAEKVMGAPVIGECLSNPDGPMPRLPYYSTDIADAWQVVEKMRNHVPDYRAIRIETVPLGYMAAFYSHKNRLDRPGAFVAAETISLAICLAALKAVGVDI